MFYKISIDYGFLEVLQFKSKAVRKQEFLALLDSINPELRSKIQDFEIGFLGSWAMFHRNEIVLPLREKFRLWYEHLPRRFEYQQAYYYAHKYEIEESKVRALLFNQLLFKQIELDIFQKVQ